MPDKSSLAEFLEIAELNSRRFLVTENELTQKIKEIDGSFHDGLAAVANPSVFSSVLFFPRAHSAFLGAVRLASGGQTIETYPLVRLVLENALYAYFVFRHPEKGVTWIEREYGSVEKQAAKDSFHSGVSNLLPEPFQRQFRELYEATIKWGAHPNPFGHISGIDRERFEDGQLVTAYLQGGKPHLLALKYTARVGVFALAVFGLVYPERFEIMGLASKIEKLKTDL